MHHPLHTPICDRLGIEYPVFLAGMEGVSLAPLVAAVSEAGGLGILGAASLGPKELREEIRKVRSLTAKPFAVDLLAPVPELIRPQSEVIYDERVETFVAGPAVLEGVHRGDAPSGGMTVVVMCGKVRHAEKAAAAGADVVVAQGTEAEGYTWEIGTMVLVPQVVDAVAIPVLAAGGLADGRWLVAALALGAQGAVYGTRLIATPQAQAAKDYRRAVLEAREDGTMRTRCYTGKPARTLRTRYAQGWEARKEEIQPFPLQAGITARAGAVDYAGRLGRFNRERTFQPAGQSVGLVRAVKRAGDVVREIIAEAVIEQRFRGMTLTAQQRQ